MELREFAERVLFATTLEEKLACPGEFTDERPGPARLAPESPGRPAALRFKVQTGAKAEFPTATELENERERGKLLHFFANHELLATELMALVLLRFPEAPSAFRRGVLQTLKDEQAHTRMYLERMRACGIGFGELPVSGYFWRCVAPMQNPIDYVAGLSLTFEQANLDFARHFSTLFARTGDSDTAALLEKIHRDEIGHVAYGLKWFRRWKQPGQTDWEAFCNVLKFPLTPQRAKGAGFNVAARRAAGFEEAFIAQLDVFAQSKGRTPGVFFFNPFAEGYVAQGLAFHPNKLQAQLARDLETLPQFLGRQDDMVLVSRRPRIEFLRRLKAAGFPLPEFVGLRSGKMAPGDSLLSRKVGALRPWAWAPDSVAVLAPLAANVSSEDSEPERRFNGSLAPLFSKAWSAGFLSGVLLEHDSAPWLCGGADVGIVAGNVEEALAAIAEIRARGHHRVVVKEEFGLAGSNALRLWEPAILETQRRWLERAVSAGRRVVIEPWRERVADFSAQFEMTSNGLKFLGYCGLNNDLKGQYQANHVGPGFERRPAAVWLAAFPAIRDIASKWRDLYAGIQRRFEKELKFVRFLGPIGIDAFIHREADGSCRLKPVVEINPRYTMGRLTLELMKHTTPGSFGEFRLVNRSALRAAGCDNFAGYVRQMEQRHPLQLAGEPVSRITAGFLCLNDFETAEVCLATFHVTREPLRKPSATAEPSEA